MILAYYSRTGNVRDFLSWYMPEYERRNIEEWDADEPFILVTPTYDFGQVPEYVGKWLQNVTAEVDAGDYRIQSINSDHLEGVIGSGNRNWGDNFAKAADTISEEYDIPLIAKFDLKGSDNNAEYIRRRFDALYDGWV